MASKASATFALLLTLNLVFLSMANAHTQNHNQPKCKKDTLVLNACVNVLDGFLKLKVGNPHSPCCSLLKGLVDLELDACLCTVVNANVLSLLKLSVPVQLDLLLNYCGMKPRPCKCN